MKLCPYCGRQYPDTMTLCSADATALRSMDDPLLGRTLAGKYRIERLIKRGGMGAVYRGKHVLMDKTVAIKVLRPSLAADDNVVARFSREAKAASRISHPHAMSVTDFGEAENGVVFLVMEYLDGRTLKDVIKTEGPMSLTRAAEIIRQVAGALDAAHGEGVVHRDLKSDNVMLVRSNGGDWAKVLDFGIAKIQQPEGPRDHDITAPNLVIGTPQYMSPEQCSESPAIDARSDVYSLGVILFEMLAGRVPFTGESPTAIMMKHLQEPAPSLLYLRPDLPKAVADVVARALAKQPADRFPTAGEMADALSRGAVGFETAPAAPRGVGATTKPDQPVTKVADGLDEVTVVRPHPARLGAREAVASLPPEPGFNPWRIIVPSIVALTLVFVAVFFITRNTGQTQTQPTPGESGLAADPNSQPVQSVAPPTGSAEHGIQPNSLATPAGASVNTNSNAKVKQGLPLPPAVNLNLNANVRENVNVNVNANRGRELPSPKPSPSSNANLAPTPPILKPSPSAQPTAPQPVVLPTSLPPPAPGSPTPEPSG